MIHARLKHPVVAFAGPMGSGKSTAAHVLRTVVPFRVMSFAEPIRAMLRALGVAEENITDPARKREPIAWLAGKSARELMQSLGTEWGRAVCGPDVWAAAVERRILDKAEASWWELPTVLDDCRFDNEAAMVHRLGGVVVLIERPGCAASAAHASERGVSADMIDHVIRNDGDAQHLLAQLRAGLVEEREV